MKKPLLFTLILLAWVLAACAPPVTPAPTEQATDVPPTTVPTEPAPPTAAPPTVAPTTAPPALDQLVSGEPMPGCTVASSLFRPPAAEESRFPAALDTDQVLGRADAPVAIVEYGDFQ